MRKELSNYRRCFIERMFKEELYAEFMQIDRFEKGITLKDVADILQIESEEE